MKKTLIFTAVFFILAALFLTCCGAPKQKIKPDLPAKTENNINVETPKSASNADTDRQDATAKPDTGKTVETDNEIAKRDITPVPEVRIREGYLRKKDERWAAVYGNGEGLDALNKIGVSVATISNIEVAQTNGRDCATTISVGGRLLSAYDFKEALGLKSTMITEINKGEGEFMFVGYGEN